MKRKKIIMMFAFILTAMSIKAQIVLNTDFTNDTNKQGALWNIWSVANRISPKNGVNVRKDLSVNLIRMVGGKRNNVNGKGVKDLDFDPCIYDSVSNTYVYNWQPFTDRLNKVIISENHLYQIVLDQPPWAFQHGYTFIPEGTRDSIHFRENEQMSIYGNSLPPANKLAYHDFIQALMNKLVDTYGKEQVLKWRFRIGSEIETPDHWWGTKQDFIDYFAISEKAIRSVLPDAKVGLHTREPNFRYKKKDNLNYKGEPFASFADDLITYCADNGVQYDFWGISDYIIIGNEKSRNMSHKFEELFAPLVNHPKWNKNAVIDLMEYATITSMNKAGNGFINCSSSHKEIVELEFANMFYKNKNKGLEKIYRWGVRDENPDAVNIQILNTMKGKLHYTTSVTGTPTYSGNQLDAIFAKSTDDNEYDVLLYNYNPNSLNYVADENVDILFAINLPVGTYVKYRSIEYGKDNNDFQNFLNEKNNEKLVNDGLSKYGDPYRVLSKEGKEAFENYTNPNPYKFSIWTTVKTIARTDGKKGSLVTISTKLPSFAFQKFEFRISEK